MKRKDYIKPEARIERVHYEYHLLSQSPGRKTLDDDDDDDNWDPGAKGNEWDDDETFPIGSGYGWNDDWSTL